MKGWRLASDIGGTFTDIAFIAEDGLLSTIKVPSTPQNYASGVIEGAKALASARDLRIETMAEMAHGCTVATNAILEGKGARVALLTTAGFRDVLELRRIRVPKLYEPLYVKPLPLAARDLRLEVRERVGADGSVVVPLVEDDVCKAAEVIARSGAEAVAVCFLHSYRFPDHERRAGALLRKLLPGCFVTLSVDVLPQIREYERTSTTVVNAYVGPPVKRYLEGMEADLAAAGCNARISVMQSSGGSISSDAVKDKPAQIVECGPAAGVVGAAHLARLLRIRNAITFDMGGTTAKGSLIEDGDVIFAENYEIGASMSTAGAIAGGGGYALKLPVIDIAEVGAGGGSIVRLDRAGAIKVGPDSAGAAPGPAAYGLGGEEPTVTDANIVLGFLNQQSLAGGTVRIDAGLSRASLERTIASPLGMSVHEAAYGVHEVANATMVRAIKAVTTYRGRNPRDFAMFAFGGNGGVHGASIARSLEIGRIYVPAAAGVFSAVGLLLAEKSVAVASAFVARLDELDYTAAEQAYVQLQREAERLLGVSGKARCMRQVEMRYLGQAFELIIDLDDGHLSTEARSELRARFDAEHERRFGHRFDEHNAVEIVALRLRASDPDHVVPARLRHALKPSETTSRPVWFGKRYGFIETAVVGRAEVTRERQAGPVIVEEYEGTTVVPPDASVFRDEFDNLVVDLQRGVA
ncbi:MULTISPECIES: hydantoinase/oxoprolinase family protein [unclassified Mesorhizobium]|uniref:hydantoinase/oxoprolinase family protein n=5 Tax=Mesorhizobium TaxID=68287 RepID=UPI000F754319|nr:MULTISPECIES: hydantoinase/oxoprolinase family protein [unclassified Mesorhizobium]TGP56566.1 hydantoinase/oxoprolinase family protein [bacterium M00.F.Ca.ET.230.01.1.1]TGP74918.1 hydantoinase/oxoprolinase family protein [bacterium M00.F.Ca.ET.227.01.1.1]TGT67828.1 hydantoinase/oxoprolinase family protein [bacterium M00.F.Ca.ET.159.01.1.1]TGT80268.1 hydantoinase/oxoprolinase family protein [bacterium M00.F.Ca.ET.157.01.1.1]TGU43479.1 hydantoinase/oxoprolinase family protein [bacterium M00.F